MTFQKKSEVAAFRSSLKKEDFFNMTNDDMVLECAEMLSDPSSSIIASSISNPMARHVFLITNDRGLAVKAMVAQIPSITSKDFPESPQDFLEGLYEVE
jgi:rRNA-processing protein FCF1